LLSEEDREFALIEIWELIRTDINAKTIISYILYYSVPSAITAFCFNEHDWLME
jgi:hypothetical protein